MSPERWREIENIFQTVVDLPPEDRAQYLAEASTGDPDLQREVQKLLSQYDQETQLVEQPAYDRTQFEELAFEPEDQSDPILGQRVGAYEILRELGRGGMGAVYLAQRADKSFQRQVAIKLVKRGMDTDYILRRFKRERQILAALDHPNIARLLDAGSTEDGRPYFVMEYIEGQPVYDYCDSVRSSIRERLLLFSRICDAVHYAHQKLVIHRDLKPGNILVSAEGTPKLLDFGIAKLLDPELAPETQPLTLTMMRMMTVEYASPEQVRGEAVSFLSDVYSLGVILYELLTSHRPYRFTNRMLHEMARVVIEQEPVRPSLALDLSDNLVTSGYLTSEAPAIERLCEMRGETLGGLQDLLAGSLDNITLKALRKDPGERYQSAALLRQDLERYLNGQPVSAAAYPSYPAAVLTPASVKDAAVRSVAVLPLKILNLGPSTDTGESYLGVGLADALITRLSGVRSLAVRPTSSVIPYGDETTDPLRAGRELAVEFVLDGRIKIAGKRIRVSLQLLDIQNGTSVWAHQFDEQFTGALELEDSISERVAEAVLPNLIQVERGTLRTRGTDSPEAFEAYLRGRFYWNKFTPDYLPKVLDSFQQAVELDPNYALAHVGVADFYNWAAIYGILPAPACYPRAKAAALRALELDDSLGEAYAALALNLESSEWKWTEVERLYLRALELSPNYSLAHEWYASLLVATGRYEEGVKEVRRAEELDPHSLRAMTLTAWTIYQARLFPEAVAKSNQMIDFDKNYPQGYIQLGNALAQVGRVEEAIIALQKSEQLMPESVLPKYVLCFALVSANRVEEAREVLNQIKSAAQAGYVKPYFLAMAYAALDERDAAFESFEQAFVERDPWLIWIGTEPKLDRLRKDPRFVELMRRTGNPLALPQATTTQRRETGGDKSIAVLPMKLLGHSREGDTGDEYLGIGVADALITRLSNVRRFIVRPTSSVLRYAQTLTDPFAAASELGVDYIVDGTIRRIGNALTISAQLLYVPDKATQWAGRFDESYKDVLELEDSLSQQVADALVPQLTTDELRQLGKRGTEIPEAFEFYLRGRYYWNSFTVEGFAKALTSYNHAIAVDPGYALAYAGIADYYIWLGIFGVVPFADAAASAKEAALNAINLDSELAEAYAAIGTATLLRDFNWQLAEDQHRFALELNPNYATGHLWYGFQLTMMGRFEEAEREIRTALKLDPLSPINKHALGWNYLQARQYEACLTLSRKLIEDEPHFGFGYFLLSRVLKQIGRHDEAIDKLMKTIELLGKSATWSAWLASAYAAAGNPDRARELLREIDEESSSHVPPYILALVQSELGDREHTLRLLEEAVRTRDGWTVWLGVEPGFDWLRDDRRFMDLLRRTENPLVLTT